MVVGGFALILHGCGGKVVFDVDGSGGAAALGSVGAEKGSKSVVATAVVASATAGVGGASVVCSTENGLGCPADQFCDYADDRCGLGKINGVCRPEPLACPPSYEPTCGCDAEVHDTPCDTQREGFDLNTEKSCVAPPGKFQCGALFCNVGEQYCEVIFVDQGASETGTCKPLPPCGATCDCLLGATCGLTCNGTGEGGIEVHCPSGI